MRKKKIKILGGTLGQTLLKEKSGSRVTTQIFFDHPMMSPSTIPKTMAMPNPTMVVQRVCIEFSHSAVWNSWKAFRITVGGGRK